MDFQKFLLPLVVPGKSTVALIYTIIYTRKLVFHTDSIWLNISKEALNLLQKGTLTSLAMIFFQSLFFFFFFFFLLSVEDPGTDLEMSFSVWIGLNTDTELSHPLLSYTETLREKLSNWSGRSPVVALLRQLVT